MNCMKTYQPYAGETKALLMALGMRDLQTLEHSERMVDLCAGVGKRCGLSSQELEILSLGAKFHDLGKIGIPDKVLLSANKLSPSEWQVMRSHSELGSEMIQSLELDDDGALAEVVLHHHEHFDGSGYPRQLAREQIPVHCRIISVVDSYDAMLTTRSYHRPRSKMDVLDVIFSEEGTKHDPYILGLFVEHLETLN